MDLQTGIVSARCHLAWRGGGEFHGAGFSSSNTVPSERCLFVLIGEGAVGS